MNNPPFFKPLALVCAALVLAGCASPSPRSAASLPPPDTSAADQMREHAAQEAQRLLVHQQMLLTEINKTAAAPVIAPVAPVFDPLEGKLINVAMSRASISQSATAASARSVRRPPRLPAPPVATSTAARLPSGVAPFWYFPLSSPVASGE